MQRVNCELRLSGDVLNTVEKKGVSPAEIVILNDLHGEGAVINIKPTEMDKTPHGVERERLCGIYGTHVVDRIFPGQFNKLPVTLKDIEVANADDENEDDQTANEVEIARRASLPQEQRDEEDAQAIQKNSGNGNSNVVDEDDKLLIDSIETAHTKDALRAIAAENEVDLTGVDDKMAALKTAIYTSLKITPPAAE